MTLPKLPGHYGRQPKPVRVPSAIRTWLEEHPAAWSGWPTFEALEWEDQQARVARLVAAGCPRDFAREVQAVNAAIADIRRARRKRVARATAATAWA